MKKEIFYKTIRNANGKGYHLEECEGYKKAYTDETGATIFLYFDNIDGYWGITEQETGATISTKFLSTLKEAKEEADKVIKTIFNIWDADSIRQARQTHFNLLCKMAQ